MTGTGVSVEGLSWAGVDVATWAVHAIDLSGLLTIPGRRSENLTVAGRDGALRVPRKPYEPRDFGVDFWVRGCDADGRVPPDGQNAEFYRNMDLLSALCVQDVAMMVHTLPDGTRRQLPVEAANTIDPTRWKAGMLARVPVEFTSHWAFWRSEHVVVAEHPGLAAGQTWELTEFAPSTGRISDALVTFGVGSTTGNNPVLTDVATGIGIGYRHTFGAGHRITVGDYSWDPTGFTFDRTQLVKDPRIGPWWVLDPVPGAAGPTVRLDLTGGGPMGIRVEARQAWAVG